MMLGAFYSFYVCRFIGFLSEICYSFIMIPSNSFVRDLIIFFEAILRTHQKFACNVWTFMSPYTNMPKHNSPTTGSSDRAEERGSKGLLRKKRTFDKMCGFVE